MVQAELLLFFFLGIIVVKCQCHAIVQLEMENQVEMKVYACFQLLYLFQFTCY